MSLALASLGSGSRGNALVVESDDTLLMVDCGFSSVQVKKRLSTLGRRPEDLDGLLISHEHNDHIAGAARLSRRYQIPVWLTHGTYARAPDQDFHSVRFISGAGPLQIKSIRVQPVRVPHDAREPTQFIFARGTRRIAAVTDLGHVTPHLMEHLRGCDGVAVEFNHDLQQLTSGPYPVSVKQRVAGPLGHLNNEQSAAAVNAFHHSELQWVLGLHVSEQNNSHEAVRAALGRLAAAALDRFSIASQDAPSAWYRVE